MSSLFYVDLLTCLFANLASEFDFNAAKLSFRKVWFGRFCLVFFFGFVNVDDLKRPLVSLKVVKSSLELNLGTNLGCVGWFGLGCVQ